MLRLNVDKLLAWIADCNGIRTGAALREVGEWITAHSPATVGEVCELITSTGERIPGEVIASAEHESRIMLYREGRGMQPGDFLFFSGQPLTIPTGPGTLGRVLDCLGQPLDQGGRIAGPHVPVTSGHSPSPLERKRITQPLCTGQRVIDGFLTLGKGQRVGLFAGSGVGKSTLLGEIVKQAQVDCNVIALVGERGREVLPFLEDALGDEGRARSVVVVATAEEPALARVQAVKSAVRIAEEFRAQGADVMFFLDSLTRLAHAQREIGLSRGEPPGTRGYPPSVFRLLAQVLERLGNSATGSITGLITVLVDGDDLAEPITDAARSILDGHIVLSRELAERNIYPAVDVLGSVSRLFREVTTPDHQFSVARLRQLLATYQRMEELIRLGLYQRGASPEIDIAVDLMPELQEFCTQEIGEHSDFEATIQQLGRLASRSTRVREVPA